MTYTKRRLAATSLALGVVGATIALTGGGAAAGHEGFRWTTVPAVSDTRGVTAPNVLSPGFIQYAVAQGSMRLENPTADVPYYVTDSSRVRAETGWRPERSLAATLADVHKWLVDNRAALAPIFNQGELTG